MTDIELLEKHRCGCEQAFADLVQRHIGWVYGVARRRLRDSHLAEDVAQAVFVLLHRKAPHFPADGAMMRWLHKTTWYASEVAVRNEQRRQRRETEAAKLQFHRTESSTDWEHLAPVLDKLIGRLSRADREAILLRYYREMPFAEVAALIGTTEDAARKRIERAIEKLRQFAADQGVALSASTFTICLSEQIRVVPPPGLIATATGAATANAAIAASSAPIIKGALFMMILNKLAPIAVAAMAILLGGTIWVVSTSTWAQQPPAPPAVRGAPGGSYPRVAPFAAVRWPTPPPQVQVNGTWYELVAIDGQPIAQIIDFARKTFGQDLWQKRFDEDLVEVLTRMGNPPADTVSLQLRKLDGGEPVTLQNVPMSEQNRRAIWENRQRTDKP